MANIGSLAADDYVFYGTAVAQLEDGDTTSTKPVPVHEQIVTDEKGKQRFHGAFTGGFHAGYWDTVGSLEGWTPRTFTSSRERKGPALQQRPEDYMDKEDLGEFGIAPQKISTTSEFSSSKRSYGASAAPDLPLKDLLPPLSESYGVTLLKKMGWKPGQGIGPRVSKREKLAAAIRMGKKLPKTLVDADEEDSLTAGKLFASDDIQHVKMVPKSNLHGIGYSGLDSSAGILTAKTLGFSLFEEPPGTASAALLAPTAKEKRSRKGMSGQAFGVGAFEADDADIYSAEDLSQYDRELDVAGKKIKAIKGNEMKSIEAPGKKTLEGFILGTTPLHKTKVFPPPIVPLDFITKQSGAGPAEKDAEPRSVNFQKHRMDANSRAVVLEEPPEKKAPPVVKSVFDLIPAAQRARLPVFQSAGKETASVETQEKVSATTPLPSKLIEEPIVQKQQERQPNVASIEEQRRNLIPLFAGASVTAESKLAFKPFEKDPEKQRRYELFLQKRREKNKDAIQEVWMDVGASMTEWERERERNEFYRAADLYNRPMSGAMAARFTRETIKDDTSNSMDVPVARAEDVSKERKTAVERKLYGKLTRDEFEWHPDRLLCKRFNVPNPYPTSTIVGLITVKKDKLSLFNFLNVPEGSAVEEASKKEESKKTATETASSAAPVASVTIAPSVNANVTATNEPRAKLIMPDLSSQPKAAPLKEIDRDEKPIERPPMDLFRAIFQDSDEEGSAKDAEDDEVVPENDNYVPEEPDKDVIESIFDLDRNARMLEKKEYPVAPERPLVVGPAKPPPEVLAAFSSVPFTPPNGGAFVEKGKEREKSKSRKKSKRDSSERKKHKKHKKKKRKHRKSDSESESSSEDEKESGRKQNGNEKVNTVVRMDHLREESPDVDELLFKKLKQMASAKRPTAADFL